jgi:hypothetical protein
MRTLELPAPARRNVLMMAALIIAAILALSLASGQAW